MKYIIQLYVSLAIVMFSASAWAAGDYDITPGDREFLGELKKKVVSDDREWVVNHVNFPIDVTVQGKRRHLRNPRQMMASYDDAFNNNVKNAIISQDLNTVFKNWQGIMIGHGQIWIMATCQPKNCDATMEYNISGINNCFDGMTNVCEDGQKPGGEIAH